MACRADGSKMSILYAPAGTYRLSRAIVDKRTHYGVFNNIGSLDEIGTATFSDVHVSGNRVETQAN